MTQRKQTSPPTSERGLVIAAALVDSSERHIAISFLSQDITSLSKQAGGRSNSASLVSSERGKEAAGGRLCVKGAPETTGSTVALGGCLDDAERPDDIGPEAGGVLAGRGSGLKGFVWTETTSPDAQGERKKNRQ